MFSTSKQDTLEPSPLLDTDYFLWLAGETNNDLCIGNKKITSKKVENNQLFKLKHVLYKTSAMHVFPKQTVLPPILEILI